MSKCNICKTSEAIKNGCCNVCNRDINIDRKNIKNKNWGVKK